MCKTLHTIAHVADIMQSVCCRDRVNVRECTHLRVYSLTLSHSNLVQQVYDIFNMLCLGVILQVRSRDGMSTLQNCASTQSRSFHTCLHKYGERCQVNSKLSKVKCLFAAVVSIFLPFFLA